MITKSPRVRQKFQKRLFQNCEAAFFEAGIEAKVKWDWGRFYVDTADEKALVVLKRIYGIHSFVVVEHICKASLETIVEMASKHYSLLTKNKTFAVRTRRSGSHSFTSPIINQAVGSAINQHAQGKVDLSHPEFELHIEVIDEQAYFYTEKRHMGVGGLPLGTAGRGVCLMSGGFDSPLAAWMMQKRGVELSFVFCNVGGAAYERSVLKVAKNLVEKWSYGTNPLIHVIDFAPLVDSLRRHVRPAYVQVVLKRLFYRAAAMVANAWQAEAIITGEAIGQVSSQTLRNLRAIEEIALYPVMRPLIAFDKDEIMQYCKKIETYDLSASIQEYCQLVPDKPVTAAKISEVDKEEEKLDLSELERLVRQRRVVDLKKLTPLDLSAHYIFCSQLQVGSQLIDCRSEQEFREWHPQGAIFHSFDEVQTAIEKWDKKTIYVIYCNFGTQSAIFAETMQAKGFEAYSWQGGVRSLKQYWEKNYSK